MWRRLAPRLAPPLVSLPACAASPSECITKGHQNALGIQALLAVPLFAGEILGCLPCCFFRSQIISLVHSSFCLFIKHLVSTYNTPICVSRETNTVRSPPSRNEHFVRGNRPRKRKAWLDMIHLVVHWTTVH